MGKICPYLVFEPQIIQESKGEPKTLKNFDFWIIIQLIWFKQKLHRNKIYN